MTIHEPISQSYLAKLTVKDFLTLAEVSVSTLDMDLGRKLRLYARHGIPEYWVVDPEAKLLHQFWAKTDGGYAQTRRIALSAPITAATIDGLTVETARL
ncbi:Uma2 family endonuclease [Sphingomonas qilianensis]|uniref:Uma2 family endonuclease n=1 Tax=Sphingomonas qilianensis TaxID=1736690 RepID=A0ABU9XVM0_9SPHN